MSTEVRNQSEPDAAPSVDDYLRKLVACARALPKKDWQWGLFTRPGGAPIETVDHLCEAQEYSARQSEVAELWGVNYGPDTPVVCFTGNGPSSEKHAQYFAAVQPGAMIWVLDELGERISRLTDALETIRKTQWRTDSDDAMRAVQPAVNPDAFDNHIGTGMAGAVPVEDE